MQDHLHGMEVKMFKCGFIYVAPGVDPSKARAELGWDPSETSFEELVNMMMEADMNKASAEAEMRQ